jgi:PTH1 family peptidyl-tRNA hydrolase
MNLSGEAARPLLQFHALSIEQLLVVHDEADFPAGTVRVKQGGGGGGHNGLSSLLDQLGSGDFIRIRVGIGRPLEGGRDMARYVLARPTPTEAEALRGGVELAADAIEAIVRDGLSRAMNQVNRGA